MHSRILLITSYIICICESSISLRRFRHYAAFKHFTHTVYIRQRDISPLLEKLHVLRHVLITCCFFKANQADAITAAFQKYSAKVLNKEQDKASILGQLRKFTEQIRTQAKEKQRTREAVKDGR